jgi:hypothetical protein
MTPQERALVDELFDRLASLEATPREPDAERAIADGLARAPHAVYALVQTVLVQDEALKAANDHIQELEAAMGIRPGEERAQGGFLDNMRDSLFGRREPRGSVPNVRAAGEPMGAPPGFRTEAPMAPGMPQQGPSAGGGGSFLGTAAAAAAGAIGGSLLMDGIRSMLGGRQHGPFAGAFEQLSEGGSRAPWGESAARSDLAREAGGNDIGRSGASGFGNFDDAQTAGVLDDSRDDDLDYGEEPDDLDDGGFGSDIDEA